MNRDIRFVIIGAGMAGILAGIRLLDAGYANFVIYEKATSLGGTWRENTYPGLTCDVPAHAYTYSFEPNPDWTSEMASGPEIRDYFERTARKYGVYDHIAFDEDVIACRYDDAQWQIETARGTRDTADMVIAATGILHHPVYPDIDGLDTFAGARFHSARWDHSIPLDGQRIGVIGTGSTGVQIVAALASRAGKLIHFQRSAQWIFPGTNEPYTEEQKAAFRSDPALLKHMQNDPAYVDVAWAWSEAVTDANSAALAETEAYALANLENSVTDPALREALRPDHRAGCKRLVRSPDYYQAIQHPNAQLVTDAIVRVEPEGVRTADGVLHELDVLVLATGFNAHQFMRPMNVTGRGGIALNDVWEKRPTAYLSISVPEFPNFYMLNGPTSPVGNFSLIDVVERQWTYIEHFIALIAEGPARAISATPDALAAYERDRIAAARGTIWASGCNNWYLDSEGVPATWPWSYRRFADEMAAPKMDAYEVA
ncbi:putative flavin-containing monooxygenase [Caenibius tardaugens NBRC 16725]|uniref:Putative flavin-containing monooxygenase n=1 Tax=Caenibius tardaugens NBRC 16725 TaxID=1219035 RepID=U3A7I9_9SPHN|nr:NAD(P)/FAD-dependent oxidoreductase [Caenibius tardaugens]AZI35727.1 NAD(P)/FAD-dependent oxidoreductase [Caenibius tardaugens NBRC 16725]GAD50718.1 putative flavin-containing monooxygenase [Caenibius tardaugens NBRC 16725]